MRERRDSKITLMSAAEIPELTGNLQGIQDKEQMLERDNEFSCELIAFEMPVGCTAKASWQTVDRMKFRRHPFLDNSKNHENV